ncbi:MAG: SDR family oxidoreductase [bacterium]|nr:MAG: SDR family oxidoreductase [bacterium]
MNWNLKGKHALISGGTRGIGLAIAEEFLQLGAAIIVIARDEKYLAKKIKLWKDKNFPVDGIAADVSTTSDRERVFEILKQKGIQLDILINNAGTNIRKKVKEYSDQEYDHIFNTNLHSTFDMCRRAYPLLQQSKSASIVNISSVAGLTHMRTGAPYGMTKAAIVQLTRNLAVEWAPDGIRVNCIAPWYIHTPLVEKLFENQSYLREVLDRTPMGRIGEAQEVAAAVAFFCMPGASFITGQCLAVDGGFMVKGF